MFEDLKKQQRDGFSRKTTSPSPGRGLLSVGDPRGRILLLVGLFVILIAVVFLLRGYAGSPEAQEITTEVPSIKIGEEQVFEGVPTLDPTPMEAIRDATVEEQGEWPEDAVVYLMTETKSTPAVYAYERHLLPINRGSAAQIEADPAPWRSKFVRFRGRIEHMREGDYGDVFGGDVEIGRVHFGRMVIEDGETPLRVFFITPIMPVHADPNEVVPELKIIHDGWVRGRGIFVKRYRDVGPDGVEVPALLVVAMKLDRDYETLPVKSRADIPFEIVDDDPAYLLRDDARGKKILQKTYPRALFRLVKYAADRAGEDGKTLREKDLKEHEKGEPLSFDDVKTYEGVQGEPAKYRMRYVRGKGAIAMDSLSVDRGRIPPEDINDAGVEEYVTGWIYTDSERLFQFIAPASLDLEWEQKTRIRYEGYFYKLQAYIARDTTDRQVPFLVLTVLEEVRPEPPGQLGQLLIALGFVLGISLLVWIILREDKTKASYRRLYRDRTRPATE